MNPTTLTAPSDEITVESVTDLPGRNEYVPCDQCDSIVKDGMIVSNRSYMFFFYKDDLLSFCKHHGERNEVKLIEQGGVLVLDTRDQLIENRLQGQP